jgi:sugar phosphate isomerase/epimerase
MKLSFMTFVCPEWKIEKVIDFASEAGYDGVELRVDEGHKHGVSSASSKFEREYVKRLL